MSETRDLVRSPDGRFVAGCPGGPGRPRRAIEQDYLAVLSETVPMDRWRAIILRALTDAEQGDARAREWLGGYLIGQPTGNGLAWMAGHERAGADPVEAISQEVAKNAMIAGLFSALREIE